MKLKKSFGTFLILTFFIISNLGIFAIEDSDNLKTNPQNDTDSFGYSKCTDYVYDYITKVDEGFELGEVSFSTLCEKYPTKVTLNYQEGKSISWTNTASITGEIEFKFIGQKCSASTGYEFSRTSSVSSSISASIEKTIEPGKYGSIKVYAHAYKTGGALKYQYQSRYTGDISYYYKPITEKLQLKEYKGFNIHFCNIRYR